MTVTDFMLARIAEDEAVARRAINSGADLVMTPTDLWNGPGQLPVIKGRRLLAECEAKRQIVEEAARLAALHPDGLATAPEFTGARKALQHAVQLLALPYASHPHYDETWRPR
ncbi:hypothetical protein Xcel_0545 [Xylanimonas cellulosilytica DSM 15894]|uniref:Uncharacterized protein n=1 Tax=Xylanimonas cellulosilytica (strain DSM 15894 / JCM 12276 / CECT 5975 / KCTC 9989 / LMG 20990 / NBRC 107835 / XIL07) TaxID=446471 RepID=D1BW81_XYLCX|nr:DUF6221 family protein [Xylanimonas cellulosilytica]ACZ29584.1 hypothetical protein Xcel_0545 [Xylanimonas cellulosilytica DSM 15894]